MSNNNDDSQDKRRFDFLMGMYSEMWGNVNRHLTVVWQSVTVLGAGLALFSLTEKHVVSTDVATGATVLICFWLMANAYVASEWFNRNQAIISNIERQFLRREDLQEINPFFDKRRKPGDMDRHIRVQWSLGAALAFLVLLRHFFVEIAPAAHFSLNIHDLDWEKTVPYLVFLGGLIWVGKIRRAALAAEIRFQRDSPGKNMGENAPPSTVSGTGASGSAPESVKNELRQNQAISDRTQQ
jgi:low affinity Fe/Cu permease